MGQPGRGASLTQMATERAEPARLMLAAERRTIINAQSTWRFNDTSGEQVKGLALLGVGAVVAAVLGGSVREASAATTSTVFSTAGCQSWTVPSPGVGVARFRSRPWVR